MVRNVFREGVLEELCLVGYAHREVIAIGTDLGLQEVWAQGILDSGPEQDCRSHLPFPGKLGL